MFRNKAHFYRCADTLVFFNIRILVLKCHNSCCTPYTVEYCMLRFAEDEFDRIVLKEGISNVKLAAFVYFYLSQVRE